MRAAFIAAQNGRQSAILVPTTLLANQHHANFRDRFAGWPYTVEVVSRFQSAKDLERIIARVQSGEVDILVGTHKLLQSDFGFHDLGLLIIDEEHRFGVKQKEAIKALRAEVDILIPEEDGDPGDMVDDRLNPRIEEISRNRRI